MRWESRTNQGRKHVNPPGLLGCACLNAGGLPCPKSPPARWGARANPAGILPPALGRLRKPFRLRRKGFCLESDAAWLRALAGNINNKFIAELAGLVLLWVFGLRLDRLIPPNCSMANRLNGIRLGFDRALENH